MHIMIVICEFVDFCFCLRQYDGRRKERLFKTFLGSSIDEFARGNLIFSFNSGPFNLKYNTLLDLNTIIYNYFFEKCLPIFSIISFFSN